MITFVKSAPDDFPSNIGGNQNTTWLAWPVAANGRTVARSIEGTTAQD